MRANPADTQPTSDELTSRNCDEPLGGPDLPESGLCLPFNPSRYSEDRARPFVKVVGPGSEGHPLRSDRRKAEEDRGTAWTDRPATYAWRHSPQFGRILRRLAGIAMMEPADHGRLDDPALLEAFDPSGLRRVLVQREVCSGAVIVDEVLAQQAT